MKMKQLLTLASTVVVLCGCATAAGAQDHDDPNAITARVHGTFVDQAGGLGVLAGDMTVVRFEVRNGAVMAIGAIVGALAERSDGGDGREIVAITGCWKLLIPIWCHA